MSTSIKKFDTIEKVMKRQGQIIGGRLRDQDKMLAAAKKMDAIRKRLSAKYPPTDSAKIIRKFRDSRRRSSTLLLKEAWNARHPVCYR